jgi:hypothetical protein
VRSLRLALALVVATVVAIPGRVARVEGREAKPEPTDLIGALLEAPAVRERTREPGAGEPERADEAPEPPDRDEIEKTAAAAHDDGRDVVGGEALEALAKLDWPRAAPLLQRFAAARQPQRAALALALTYRHEVATGGAATGTALRKKLQAIATDRKQPGAARDAAFDALLETEWPGRDDWYLAQFSDPTLRPLRDVLALPLTHPVAREPDRWIPVMTRLLGSRDRAVHDQAVACLVQFQLEKARADALRPLLPWLADPAWSSADDRLRLIQSLEDLDMKEAVPGLIAVVGQRPTAKHDEFERSYAAEALAYFRDPRAVPALRLAIPREKRWDHLKRLYEGLVASGGVPSDEEAAALEAVARKISTPDGRDAVDQLDFIDEVSLPPAVALGLFLSRGSAPEEATVERLVARARALDGAEPAVATALREIFDRWESAAADRDLARRLEAGQLSTRSVWQALAKRASLRRNAGAELRKVAARGDRSAAVAAVLLGDAKAMTSLLGGKDADARAMLLACARLVGDKLPLDRVAALLASREGHLPDAAEAYLQADDSPEARRALLAAAAGQARILGNRTEGDPGHVTFSEFDHIEEQLRRSLLEPGGPDEILALLSAGYWGGRGQIIVRVTGGKARLQFVPDEARRFERDLTASELASLRALLAAKKADTLGPLDTAVADGLQLELVRVTRAGGRRVFMNNPDMFKGAYAELCDGFRSLVAAPGLTLRYDLAEHLQGLEVLVADPSWQVAGVMLDGGKPIIEVANEAPSWGAGLPLPKEARLARPAPPGEQKAHLWLTWPAAQAVAAGRLGPLSLSDEELPKNVRREAHLNEHGWANRRDGAAYVVAEVARKDGLWRLAGGRAPALVAAGSFASPVLSRDGRWVLAARAQKSWAEPNDLVRIDTRSGRIQRVDIPAADNLEPIITTPQGVLVARFRDDADAFPPGTKVTGPEKPEHFVVDPETARVRKLDGGDFSPIPDDSRHPFQPAGADTIWAARWDEAMQASLIGRYDLGRFVFTPVMELRGLRVGTDDIWVDEPAARVYAVYGGHLLRFPLGR